MKTISFNVPTTEELKKAATTMRNTTRSARGSMASRLQRFAKRIEPKPAKHKAERVKDKATEIKE